MPSTGSTHDQSSPQPIGERAWRGLTLAQWYCLIVGILLAARGLQQLIGGASFAAPGDGWRASQQLLTAIVLLVAHRNRLYAKRVLIPFAIYYAVLSIVGDINGHEAFGLVPVDGRDLIFHPIYAVTSIAILWLSLRPVQRKTAANALPSGRSLAPDHEAPVVNRHSSAP
jgi:hypothetical protein